jgi:hypothetical protein
MGSLWHDGLGKAALGVTIEEITRVVPIAMTFLRRSGLRTTAPTRTGDASWASS